MKIFQLLIASMGFIAQMAWAQVNINTADIKELTALRGIGEKKAQAIIHYRKANGKFKSVSELTQVKGIGEKTVKRLGSDLKTSGVTDVTNLKNTSKAKANQKRTDKKKTRNNKTKTSKKS